MGKSELAAFRPVNFVYGNVHMSGGLTNRKHPMTVKMLDDAKGKSKTFVKMSTREKWLVHSTTGALDIGRTSLLDNLRERIAELCDGAEATEATEQPAAEYDPMVELAVGTGSSGSRGYAANKRAKVQRWRFPINAAKHCISTIDMQAECPEVDPTGKARRIVSVYVEDRVKIWLSIDDVAWAVKYLFTQHQLKGIPLVAANDPGPGAPSPPLAILGEGGTAAVDETLPLQLS